MTSSPSSSASPSSARPSARRSSSVTAVAAPGPHDDVNVVVLRGTVAGEPTRRELPNGSVFETTLHTRVVIADGIGREPVPIVWDVELGVAHVGDNLVVRGRVRQRFFRSGGATMSRTEVVASEIVPVRRRKAVQAAVARAELVLSRLVAE
jgi:hypothetical protein